MFVSLHRSDASLSFARPDNAVQEEFAQEFLGKIDE